MAKKKVLSRGELRSEATAFIKTGFYYVATLKIIVEEWLEANPEPKQLPELTSRQNEIFSFIKDSIRQYQTPPTVREIGTQFNISSPNGVMCHLKALERKGLISRREGISRNIAVNAGY